MVVPDFELICEIMLVAEGFQEARVLARKFITLYTLCRELLSKQDHYDWGLRAIKSVLVVAGSLKVSAHTVSISFSLLLFLKVRKEASTYQVLYNLHFEVLEFYPLALHSSIPIAFFFFFLGTTALLGLGLLL
jgi:hypothetical protein